MSKIKFVVIEGMSRPFGSCATFKLSLANVKKMLLLNEWAGHSGFGSLDIYNTSDLIETPKTQMKWLFRVHSTPISISTFAHESLGKVRDTRGPASFTCIFIEHFSTKKRQNNFKLISTFFLHENIFFPGKREYLDGCDSMSFNFS